MLTEDKEKLIKEFRIELATIIKVYTKDDVCDENVIEAIVSLCKNKGSCLQFEKEGGD